MNENIFMYSFIAKICYQIIGKFGDLKPGKYLGIFRRGVADSKLKEIEEFSDI